MASNFNVTPENMSIEISDMVRQYTESVSTDVTKEIDDTASKMLDEIKRTAPHKTGKYRKGFKIKKDNKSGRATRTIYNKTCPGLVHLLEFGHVIRNGTGRYFGKTDPRPHMRPVYDKYVPQMEKNIDDIIKNGGRK